MHTSNKNQKKTFTNLYFNISSLHLSSIFTSNFFPDVRTLLERCTRSKLLIQRPKECSQSHIQHPKERSLQLIRHPSFCHPHCPALPTQGRPTAPSSLTRAGHFAYHSCLLSFRCCCCWRCYRQVYIRDCHETRSLAPWHHTGGLIASFCGSVRC